MNDSYPRIKRIHIKRDHIERNGRMRNTNRVFSLKIRKGGKAKSYHMR